MYRAAPLLLRISWPVSLIAFLITCHVSLPRPNKLLYYTTIKRGWKQGTKLKFQKVEGLASGIDVVFIIQEKKHDRFTRLGNDLQTTAVIPKSKAIKGCKIMIDPLGGDKGNELPIVITLKKGEAMKYYKNQEQENKQKQQRQQKQHVVRVSGRGWPKNDGSKGDLVVTIKVVSDSKYKRRIRRQEKGQSG